jgi:hypothetical protein
LEGGKDQGGGAAVLFEGGDGYLVVGEGEEEGRLTSRLLG